MLGAFAGGPIPAIGRTTAEADSQDQGGARAEPNFGPGDGRISRAMTGSSPVAGRLPPRRKFSFRTAEGAVVAAILVMLAGLVIPTVRTVRSRAADRRAQSELARIRSAIERFMADVGTPPARDRDGQDGALLRLLGSGLIADGAYYATDERQGYLDDHLARNRPTATDGAPYDGWKGPYLDPVPPDPWGFAYVVVLYPLLRDDGRDCVVVSAGSNGVMDADYASIRGAVAVGDDLLEVVSRPARR
jgi:type II secretory pathway pseudopilin PulG